MSEVLESDMVEAIWIGGILLLCKSDILPEQVIQGFQKTLLTSYLVTSQNILSPRAGCVLHSFFSRLPPSVENFGNLAGGSLCARTE